MCLFDQAPFALREGVSNEMLQEPNGFSHRSTESHKDDLIIDTSHGMFDDGAQVQKDVTANALCGQVIQNISDRLQ